MDNIDFIVERKILKIGNKLNYLRKEDLQKYNLTSTQSETILFYSSNEGKSINDLKNHLKISHQAAKKLIDKLKEKGYVSVSISAEDARFCCIHLTDSGKELCSTLKQNGALAGSCILSNLSLSEKQNLLNYLNEIEKNFE